MSPDSELNMAQHRCSGPELSAKAWGCWCQELTQQGPAERQGGPPPLDCEPPALQDHPGSA